MALAAEPPSESSEPTPSPNVTSGAVRTGSIMVAALLLSRILGLVRDTVMTARFGIGPDTDSYRIAVQIPDFIFMLIAGGGLQNAFMPIFADLWHKDRRPEAWKVFSSVATLAFLGSTVLVLLAMVFNQPLIGYFAEGKTEAVRNKAATVSLVMLPMQVAFLTGSVLLATLYARKRFVGPALAPNLYNVGLIAGAAILPVTLGMGVESMAWGALAGAIVGNLVIPAYLMARAGSEYRFSLDTKDPGVRKFFVLLLPVILGFSLPSMVTIITQKFAATIPVEGSNTIMSLVATLTQAPLGIFGHALALAAFPVLAEFVATDRMDRFRDHVSRTLGTVTFLGLASGAVLFALAPNVVHLLYGYGKASANPGELALTAEILRWAAPGVAFWCMQPVLTRGFFSLQKTFQPIALGTVMTALFIGLCIAFRAVAPADLRPLALASNLAGVGLAIVLFIGLERQVGTLDRARVLSTLGKGSLAALAAVAVGWPIGILAGRMNRGGEFALTFFAMLAMAWTLQLVGRALKMPETAYLDRAFARLSRRKA